ncbi:Ovarian tumor otubain [Penicillium paradoxum]|uniref:Ovarian tumor otubain n=1 Tax=Penicillium paradoxum TaxID=176176 RepID=UPI0025492372|nr:Ovarian tumor otubain [Penicillium paradoxum]KAJ5779611.1 Ovarian tumor otubain [Penicillium paradoxum]
MEELLAKHRKEQKRSPRADHAKEKRELSEKQQAEIAELNGDSVEGLEDLSLEDGQPTDDEASKEDKPTEEPQQAQQTAEATSEPPAASQQRKPNRQKARLARRAAEQAAQSAAAAEEAATQTNYRGNEQGIMDAAFKKLGLKEVEVTPDGHCLYSAVAKQLDESGVGLRPDPSRIMLQPATQSRIDTVASPQHDGYRAVRAVTADFITEHKEDFEAFMEEPLESYTRKIKLTAEWGGQLELQAIARAYGVEINVVQSDGRMEKIESGDSDSFDEEEKRKRVIWLAYYRHTYGLGEHYNALVKK